jgi:hypothetical protein
MRIDRPRPDNPYRSLTEPRDLCVHRACVRASNGYLGGIGGGAGSGDGRGYDRRGGADGHGGRRHGEGEGWMGAVRALGFDRREGGRDRSRRRESRGEEEGVWPFGTEAGAGRGRWRPEARRGSCFYKKKRRAKKKVAVQLHATTRFAVVGLCFAYSPANPLLHRISCLGWWLRKLYSSSIF